MIDIIIEIGDDLIAVKKSLPQGSPALKTESISEMKIDPSDAWLLAAPSAPDEARHAAVEGGGGKRAHLAAKVH